VSAENILGKIWPKITMATVPWQIKEAAMHTSVVPFRKRDKSVTDSADAGSQLMPWREQVAALARETDRAFLVAFRVTSSRALAEEAVQEAYARLL
jgi:hypothetical protein